MLCLGPPVRDFRTSGAPRCQIIKSGEWEGSDHRHKFIDDERNELFREFVKYVEHFQPQVFVMENVKGMKSYETKKHGTIVDIIEAEFRRLGYEVEVDVMDSSGFGVAQNRQRLIFLGTRKASTHASPSCCGRFPFPMLLQICLRLTRSPVHQRVNCLTVQERQGSKRRKQTLRYLKAGPSSTTAKKFSSPARASSAQGQSPGSGYFPLLRSGENGPRVLYKHVYPDMLKLVKKNLPKGYAMAGKRKGYVVYKKDNPDTKWVWYKASSFGDKMRRLKIGEPSPTVVAHLAKDGYMFVHPTEDRTISILEAARIQSFPDGLISRLAADRFPTKCAK